jgi:hypothetical protein
MAGSDLTPKQQQALDAFKDGGDVKDVAKVDGHQHGGGVLAHRGAEEEGLHRRRRPSDDEGGHRQGGRCAPAPEVPEAPAAGPRR